MADNRRQMDLDKPVEEVSRSGATTNTLVQNHTMCSMSGCHLVVKGISCEQRCRTENVLHSIEKCN